MTKKQNPTKSKDWFLETSVPRNLLFGHPLQKTDIKTHLGETKSWSSHYVRMEYKRSVVQALINIYYVALEEETPGDAMKYFSQTFKPREAKTVLSAIGELSNEPDVLNNKQKFLLQLQMYIESAQRHFDNLIELVKNETDCPLARASTTNGYEVFRAEIKCRTLCKVESLWRKSKGKLKKLISDEAKRAYCANIGFIQPLEIIKNAIDAPTAPKTQTNCKKVGDFVIALEMPKSCRMLTTDKAFEAICGILNQDVVRLRSLSELRKERREQPPF
jgi:hypothetical protein